MKSQLVKHAIEEKHNFDYENLKILDHQKYWKTRKNMESM